VKLAVLSDIHANGDALAAVVRELEGIRPDRVYHLGDLVGYNAEPEDCVRWAMGNTAGGVSGNHDAVACGRSAGRHFHRAALQAALWSARHVSGEAREYLAALPVRQSVEGGSLLVHGSPGDPDQYVYTVGQAAVELGALSASPGDGPVFFGHTHLAGAFLRREDGTVEGVRAGALRLRRGERALVNPGSVGQPRDRNPDASFVVYDPSVRTVTWVRVPYDVESARRKVLAAGLPPVFAERLRDGT
jgi:diadenosine tetraphosphatase ApaH/serine/threonine PP2A family protein phosphatase